MNSERLSRKSWPRRHKWLIALLLLLVVSFAAVQAVKYFVQIDRYRDHVVRLLEENTGMPVSIERLELALLPQPMVTARNVTLDDGDLRIQCREVRATARWHGLLSREINVTSVNLIELDAALPTDLGAVNGRIETVRERLKTHEKPDSPWRVSVDRVRVRSARISMAGIDRPVFEGSVEARDVLSQTVPIGVAAALPFLGEPARLEAEIVASIDRDAEPAVIPSGWLEVRNVDPREVFDRDAMPPLIFESRAVFAEITGEAVGMDITGQSMAAQDAPDLVRAAAGPFTAKLWLREGDIIVNDLHLQAPNLTLEADATRSADGALACEIRSARAYGDALSAVYAMVDSDTLELLPKDEAEITATGVLAGLETDGALRLVRGDIAFDGVTPILADGSRPFGDIQGKLRLDEGMLHIDEIKGTGLTLRGSVTPDLERAAAAVRLTGALTLSPGVVQAFAKNDTLQDLSGNVAFERIAGTFEKGQTLPEDLAIDGKIENTRAVLLVGDIEETLTGLKGTFAAEPGAVTVNASCQSALLGPVSAVARIVPEEQRIAGTLKADLARLNLPFPEDETTQTALRNVAEAYGASEFSIEVTLPRSDGAAGALRVTRQGAPELSAVAALTREEGAVSLGALEASAGVPLPAARELLPEMVRAEGIAAIQASIPAGQQRMDARVDLTEASFHAGEYAHKKPGDPATMHVLATRVQDQWQLETATLHYGGQALAAKFENGRISSDFDLNVAAFQNLFAQDVRADGRARGMFKTNPVELDVMLHDCALGLSDDLRFDSVSGRLAYANEIPRVENLTVRGLNSDFTLTLHEAPGPIWKGTVHGNRLDVDAVTAAIEGFGGKEDKETAESRAAEGGRAERPWPGLDVDVQLASVHYRNARVGDVRAAVTGKDGVYDINNLAMAPGAGRITGTAQVRMSKEDSPSTVAMDLALRDVDLSVVDGLAFSEPRGLKGLTSGTVKIQAPFGGGINPTNGATGTVAFVSQNGTLGSMGIATQILTVLRATEIIRLRVPSLRDEGLAFDTCQARAVLEDGFMTIQEFSMKSPTLAMAASGTIDFPRDYANMEVDVHFLQMATQVLDIVSLDDVAEQIRRQSSYRLSVTGPPTEPRVSMQGLTTGEGLGGPVADTARDAARTGQQTVVDVLQGSANILRGILGRGDNQEQSQQTQPSPAP